MLNIAAGLALGILALVWVVYPCVIAVLALFRRPEVSDSTAHVMPSVSIVLASRDGPCLVEARIRDLIRSDLDASPDAPLADTLRALLEIDATIEQEVLVG